MSKIISAPKVKNFEERLKDIIVYSHIAIAMKGEV